MLRTINQAGQAIIEVTIASGLAVMVVSAIAITTIIGLRNSQFAQNQILATKYAQDAIEQVQNIQNQNCPVIDNSTPSVYYYWVEDASNNILSGGSTPDGQHQIKLIWTSSGGSFSLSPANDSNFNIAINTSTCNLTYSATPEKLFNNRFSRSIKLDALNPPVSGKIKVSVTVQWTDYSGNHQSNLVTILSQY